MQYNGLHDLVNLNPEARKYFDDLPTYIQNQISSRSYIVNTLDDLHEYAEKLLDRDD